MRLVDSSYLVFALLIGASLGSFACTVADRLRNNISVSARSRCNACGYILDVLSLTPVVGFFYRKGRCRQCDAPIPVSYPVVEIGLGTIVLGAFLVHGSNVSGFQTVVVAWLLTTCSLTDLRYGTVPNMVVASGAVVGFVLLSFVPPREVADFLSAALLSVGIGLGIRLLGIVLFGKPGMGFGDVKLFGACGLLSGIDVLLAIWIGVVLAGVHGVIGLITRRLTRSARLPFVPYFAAGVLISKLVTRLVL